MHNQNRDGILFLREPFFSNLFSASKRDIANTHVSCSTNHPFNTVGALTGLIVLNFVWCAVLLMNFLLPSGTVWQEQGAPRGRSGQKQDSGRPGIIFCLAQIWVFHSLCMTDTVSNVFYYLFCLCSFLLSTSFSRTKTKRNSHSPFIPHIPHHSILPIPISPSTGRESRQGGRRDRVL